MDSVICFLFGRECVSFEAQGQIWNAAAKFHDAQAIAWGCGCEVKLISVTSKN